MKKKTDALADLTKVPLQDRLQVRRWYSAPLVPTSADAAAKAPLPTVDRLDPPKVRRRLLSRLSETVSHRFRQLLEFRRHGNVMQAAYRLRHHHHQIPIQQVGITILQVGITI